MSNAGNHSETVDSIVPYVGTNHVHSEPTAFRQDRVYFINPKSGVAIRVGSVIFKLAERSQRMKSLLPQ